METDDTASFFGKTGYEGDCAGCPPRYAMAFRGFLPHPRQVVEGPGLPALTDDQALLAVKVRALSHAAAEGVPGEVRLQFGLITPGDLDSFRLVASVHPPPEGATSRTISYPVGDHDALRELAAAQGGLGLDDGDEGALASLDSHLEESLGDLLRSFTGAELSAVLAPPTE